MSTQGTVHIVDDDPAIRNALSTSLEMRGLSVKSYDTAESFIDSYNDDHVACLVLDIKMPGMNGLELQKKLINKNFNVPIIFVTGHGDVPMSVEALKNGAIDFLEKPYRQEILHNRIEQALLLSSELRQKVEGEIKIKECYISLTPREKQIMEMLTSELPNTSNKKIAAKLEISPRTVEDHRAQIMLKMQAKSPFELVEMAKICNIYHPEPIKFQK